MTFRQDDLATAVEQGVITEHQAAEITRLANARRVARPFALGREERFRLLGGFNDFFVAIGVILLGFGLVFAASDGKFVDEATLDPSRLNAVRAACWTSATLVMWGLAELLTGRLRLTAPSIVTSIFLGAFAFWATMYWSELVGISHDFAALIASFGAAIVIALHYLRFGLPFTLLPMGMFVGYLFVMGTSILIMPLAQLFRGELGAPLPKTDVDGILPWVAFCYGILVFLAAMRFDISDRERLTTRADCGFWLHMLAAPLLVHPIVGPMFAEIGAGQAPTFTIAGFAFMAVFTIVLAFVALVIDRRALLVSGLGYIGTVISYAVSQLAGGASNSLIVTPLILGTAVIILGVCWRDLRSWLMTTLPEFRLKASLPPYAP